jgi:hypothetical protein
MSESLLTSSPGDIPRSASQEPLFSPLVERAIKDEMAAVQLRSQRVLSVLSQRDAKNTGIDIIHLLVMDLLGRESKASRIFKTKSASE